MSQAYIDTSILAAYYCPESLSLIAEKTLKNCAPVISDLTETELASAVSKKVRGRELSLLDAQKILALFQSHLEDGFFQKIAIQPQYFALANSWIKQFITPLRTLDALHLAVAQKQNLPLITGDKSLAQAAKKLGVKFHLLT